MKTGAEIGRGLRGLYRSPVRKNIFDRLSRYQRFVRETTAERIQRECDSNYQDILELFQGLEDLEVGKYLVGRRGNKTRISWNYDPRDVAAVARGECDNLELSERNDDSKRLNEEPLMRECEFPLRPDLKILFSLPDDFTQKEADRLAAFLKTLPFE